MKVLQKYFLTTFLLSIFYVNNLWACACGCGMFDVSTSSLIPNAGGGLAYLEYDAMNQDKNWSQLKSSSAVNNSDKNIRTDMLTAGVQYMFNRDWGLNVRVPYEYRVSKSQDDNNDLITNSQRSIGDIRVTGIYSGFSSDMATGLIFGTKLATGDYKYKDSEISRDTEIGTGSTDVIIGGYHLGRISPISALNYFVQGTWDKPIMVADQYRPGDDINVATGISFDSGKMQNFSKVTPILQLIFNDRFRDHGANGDSDNSGYRRVLIAPGIETQINQFKLYADIELPIYQYFNGNQLAAKVIAKFIVGYKF